MRTSYPIDHRRTQHAVYASATDSIGDQETFRIGLPTDWHTAQDRWLRLDGRRRGGRAIRIRYNRRWYTVQAFEVRSVDRHGRGLGSERHGLAFPVPYRAARLAA